MSKKKMSLTEIAENFGPFTEKNSGVPKGKSKPIMRKGFEAVFTSHFRRATKSWVCGVTLERKHCPSEMAARIASRGDRATHAAWCLSCDTLSEGTTSRRKAIELCKKSQEWGEGCKKETV